VIRAFKQKEKTGGMKSPAGFFIFLAKSEASGTLIVDDVSPASSQHPSHKAHVKHVKDDQPSQAEIASQLAWLHDTAGREGLTVKQVAKQFNQEHLLEVAA